MSAPETTRPARLVTLRLPVWWTFLPVSEPIGALWLRALQMTIIPLVAALLVLGITQLASAARAGATARRMLVFVAAALVFGGRSESIRRVLVGGVVR